MTTQQIKRKLVDLGAEYLAEKLIEWSDSYRPFAKELELLVIKNDPKALAKKINREISGLKRSARFVPPHETGEIIERLSSLSSIIENDLMPSAPQLAIDMIEKLFSVEEKLYERVDDSYGYIGNFFYTLSELWGRAWESFPDRDIKEFATRLLQLLINNEYYSKDDIIKHSGKALGEEGLQVLETLVNAEPMLDDNALTKVRHAIADAQGDVDKYIAVSLESGNLSNWDVYDVAQRLTSSGRGAEAVDFLLNQGENLSLPNEPLIFDPSKVAAGLRFDHLLEAYDAAGMAMEASALRWQLFQLTLKVGYYLSMIEGKSSEEIEKIKHDAIACASHEAQNKVLGAVVFLTEIGEYQETDKLIQRRFLDLESDYTALRPISTKLVAEGYPLAATLLRRKLIEAVLDSAKAKNYKYAINDFKQIENYAEKVSDWCGFEAHEEYIMSMHSKHYRKSAFWPKVLKE